MISYDYCVAIFTWEGNSSKKILFRLLKSSSFVTLPFKKELL